MKICVHLVTAFISFSIFFFMTLLFVPKDWLSKSSQTTFRGLNWEHNKSVCFRFAGRNNTFGQDAKGVLGFLSSKKGQYSSEDQHELTLTFSLDIQFSFSFLRYDPKTDTWTMVAPLSMPRDAVGVCLLGDKLYAVGGYDGQTYLNTMEAYDPQTNEWTQVVIFICVYIYICICNVF